VSHDIRTFDALTTEEIVRLARQQADSGEACAHGFEVGTTEACAWERAYVGRRIELDQVEV
jgi:hypothetical protein